MKIAVIYHDADFDGKLSRDVCNHFLKMNGQEVVNFGWDYGRPVPNPGVGGWGQFERIYIVDLSVAELMSNEELHSKIIWIDHHRSAIEIFDSVSRKDALNGYRIDGVAACRLCWQWFSHEVATEVVSDSRYLPKKEQYISRFVSEPELLRLAGEYDIWDHRDDRAKPLQFGLRSLTDVEYETFVKDQLCGAKYGNGPSLLEVVEIGKRIKDYCDQQNLEYGRKHFHTINFEGVCFCCLNTSGRNSSHFEGILDSIHEACFCWRYDGRTCSISLYHAPGHEDIDLSQIAVKYGGGGHKGACGFRLDLETLAAVFKNDGIVRST